MRFDVEGATLDYDLAGSGPLVVQAHGMMSSREADARYGFDLTGLRSGHTLLRYDARGHGSSTGRAEPGDYTWPALATDLLALLDHLAGPEPVDAVGASMGTVTILTAALRRPDRFRRLVLFIPPTAWQTRVPQRDMYEAGASAIEIQGLEPFLAAMTPAMGPPVLAELGVQMLPQVPESLLPSVFRGAARSDLPDVATLAGVPHPTLLLPWAGDTVHPVETAQTLADAMPDTRTVLTSTAADVRRWPQLVTDFLGRQTG